MFHFKANSIAAPFFSDPASGFIDGFSAMDALRKVVKNYDHSCGLYSATIEACEPKPRLLARYLSARAIATEIANELTEGGLLKERDEVRILKDGERIWIPLKLLANRGKYEYCGGKGQK